MLKIEVFWVMLSSFGLSFSLYDLWDATIDLRLLGALGIHDARLVVAKRNVRAQAMRSLALGLIGSSGVLALLVFDTTSVRAMLVLHLIVLVIDSVAERRSRRQLLNAVQARRTDLLHKRRGRDYPTG